MTPPTLVGRNFFGTYYFPVLGAKVTIVRPNNVLAYVAGNVFGAAADARVQIPIPAIPADSLLGAWQIFSLVAVQHRAPSDGATPQLNVLLNAGPFTSVLGDQAMLALSDADIGTLWAAQSTFASGLTFSTGAGGAGAVNASATPAGRRGTMFTFNPLNAFYLAPGGTLGLYLWIQGAYSPVASETIDLVPVFSYSRKFTLH